jgi:hypothetical protein
MWLLMGNYSFCETVTAAWHSKWHIRKLTSKGRKLSGGADTKALCGKTVAWDLKVAINDGFLAVACPACAEEYSKVAANGGAS